MITIAGGILLAVAVLACLPIIITGLAWLISVVIDRGKWVALAITWLVIVLASQ